MEVLNAKLYTKGYITRSCNTYSSTCSLEKIDSLIKVFLRCKLNFLRTLLKNILTNAVVVKMDFFS